MKTIICADIHGNIDAWHSIVNTFGSDAGQILIAGDVIGAGLVNPFSSWYKPKELFELIQTSSIPVTMIKGNCDKHFAYPNEATGTIEGNLFYMCHGHTCSTDDDKIELARMHDAAIFISGHTHEYRLEKIEDILFINPGSPTNPKGTQDKTIVIVEHNTIALIEIYTHKTLQTIC